MHEVIDAFVDRTPVLGEEDFGWAHEKTRNEIAVFPIC
jgi:hypothetical protein